MKVSNIKTSFRTVRVIAFVAVLLAVFDYFAFKNPAAGDTLSEVLLLWSMRHPVVPFLFGVISGHLFWPQVISIEKEKVDQQ